MPTWFKWFALARTFLIVLVAFAFCLAGFWTALAYSSGNPSEWLYRSLAAYLIAVVALAFAIALKAAMEHAVGGVGIGPAFRNIFTSSRPPEPPAGTPGGSP